jgi:cell division protein FtsW (lipid II flippase)
MGKLLIIIGIVFIVAGIIVMYSDKIPYLGKLPGDIQVERENFRFYFPVMTSIILSILISLILYFINRWKN